MQIAMDGEQRMVLTPFLTDATIHKEKGGRNTATPYLTRKKKFFFAVKMLNFFDSEKHVYKKKNKTKDHHGQTLQAIQTLLRTMWPSPPEAVGVEQVQVVLLLGQLLQPFVQPLEPLLLCSSSFPTTSLQKGVQEIGM